MSKNEKWDGYVPYKGNDINLKKDGTAYIYRETGQTTNYPHTVVEVNNNGGVNWHTSDSRKGDRIGVREVISGAVDVARHVMQSGSSDETPKNSNLSDINSSERGW